MGAWGVKVFDDDDAIDWAYGLDSVTDLSLVESALATVQKTDGYLEAPDASNALAACEVLARLRGHSGYQNSYTEKVDQWVAVHPCKVSPTLVDRASTVIDRILGENSELRELWSGSDENDQWLKAVEDLRHRMRA